MSQEELRIKMKYDSRIRIITLKTDITYNELVDTIRESWHISKNYYVELTYVDEGDIVEINDDNNLKEAISHTKTIASKTLFLTINIALDLMAILDRIMKTTINDIPTKAIRITAALVLVIQIIMILLGVGVCMYTRECGARDVSNIMGLVFSLLCFIWFCISFPLFKWSNKRKKCNCEKELYRCKK